MKSEPRRIFALTLAAALLNAPLAVTAAGRPRDPKPTIFVAAGQGTGSGSRGRPFRSLREAFGKKAAPGATICIDGSVSPLVEDVSLRNVRGEVGKPVVLRGLNVAGRTVIRGRLKLKGASHVVVEGLDFEPPAAVGEAQDAGVSIEDGEHTEVRNCQVTAATGDGVRLSGTDLQLRGVTISACEGTGVVVAGRARIEGVCIQACGKGAIRAAGQVTIANALLLHNRGPAVRAVTGASVRCYHNLLYDNSGGVILDGCSQARVLNNILLNNYATTLLADEDVEISVASGSVEIDHNVYFRHPSKDKLLRGLPYAQGVDLSPLPPENPFGLRLRSKGRVVSALTDQAWGRFDKHSQTLDILQRFTGANTYTRSYEDLFADLQQENFKPRFTSPAVGRGVDLSAEVPVDVAGAKRNPRHPDIGPYAAPAAWWADLDSGRATIVDGSVPLDDQGRDVGLGTTERPFSTLAKALAFARWGSRIYIKDSIYRHTAIQTTFSLGPDSLISGFPGHRPAFSPSEFIESSRWEKLTGAGLYRARDWHTFLGYNCRMNAWMQDFYGNSRVGGPGANATSLARNVTQLPEPFRAVRFAQLDRDTPQVLADGVALQPAGGVLGLEEFGIGTCSVWGRDVSHLRPGSFMVGRRDFLVSRTVGALPLKDGQYFPAGLNANPDWNYRLDGRNTGFVSEFVTSPTPTWEAVHTYPSGDRLWRLAPAVTVSFGKLETRTLTDGWVQVHAGADSVWWVRQFALPVHTLRRTGAPAAELTRCEATRPHTQLPPNGWLQRQYQTGDSVLAAALENPFQDYLEVRLPAGQNPNTTGLEVTFFNGRVEAVWRKGVEGSYSVGVNAPGLAMLSAFRTMEVQTDLATTAATARSPWQFGFLTPLGETLPVFLLRVPAEVDPNVEDPWKFTVVDDCLYVWLPNGDDPARHSIEAACGAVNYEAAPPGGNSSFSDWEEAGLLRPDQPATRLYQTTLDFGSSTLDPLWLSDRPMVWTQGFEVDPADPKGQTVRLLDEVRLDAANAPGTPGDKLLLFTYFEGTPEAGVKREHRVPATAVGPDRRIVLPSRPVAFPQRGALLIAPASEPDKGVEQRFPVVLRMVKSREELAPCAALYDRARHRFFVCGPLGAEPEVCLWSSARSDPIHHLRGVYTVGGNSYGHQKQYGWTTGLGMAAEIIEDVSSGFCSGRTLGTVPGSVVRDCTFRWCQAEIGRGGEVSGDVRHTADRIKRPELHVDHCIFDVSNAFLFDGNDNPTKNIPFANHHLWENNYFLTAMCGMAGPWWDQYCFNNVVQNNVFAGRGGVDVEVSENLIVRNNLFVTDKGSAVTFRGSDRGYAFNNTSFRGGGIWFHSEPQRLNLFGEQAQPTYGSSFPVEQRGPVPWLTAEPIDSSRPSLSLGWRPLAEQKEVYYCENWDLPAPLLIDAKGFQSYRAATTLVGLPRGSYYHDAAARRLYVRLADGSPPVADTLAEPHIIQTEEVRRDMVYTMTVVRAGRLSLPHRFVSKTELEIMAPLKPADRITVRYEDAAGPRQSVHSITAAALAAGRPRLQLPTVLVNERIFVGLNDELPPRVRVSASRHDQPTYEEDLIPGATLAVSPVLNLRWRVLPGHFPYLRKDDQFETVLHSRSVYHLASVNNVFLDIRSHVYSDAARDMHHGQNYLLWSEHEDSSHSEIDYNCYWKDLHAVPGPVSAYIHWGKERVWNTSADKEGITLKELTEKTGYEEHGVTPPCYFTLVVNPLRFDFRPLPDSPLLGAGKPMKQQVGDFLFDPDPGNGFQRFTYKGTERDLVGQLRGKRPTLGAVERPLPGAKAYYVSPTGRDAADNGTRAAPWATAAFALERMRPGDLLVLLPGTYTERLVVNRSGTPRDFLHLVAANPPYEVPGKFAHSGSSVLDAAALGREPAVLLDGCAHVRVAGLRVIHSQAPAAVELRGTRDCVIEYVFVDDPTGAGIHLTGRGNTAYECRVTGGAVGYEVAGSLTDLRWCAAEGSAVGFRAVGPVAGVHLLQNRHCGGAQEGYDFSQPASDLVLDGNWADSAAGWGFRVGGERVLLANNVTDHTGGGIRVVEGASARVFNNSVLSATGDGLEIGEKVTSLLALNNVLQSEGNGTVLPATAPAGRIWLDYNLYTRATLPFDCRARRGEQPVAGLTAWTQATGFDRNSRVAPLIYLKQQDRNGRWRVRERAISVSNLTPHFNTDLLGANVYPHTGGGSYILDFRANWKPWGDPARRVYVFGVDPNPGALSARSFWYAARIDYRRENGSRAQEDLQRVELPPEALPPGTFTQDPARPGVFVRLPLAAQDPNPIGEALMLSPGQAVGYYVGREAKGPAEPYRGKLVTEEMARGLAQVGSREIEVIPNVLSCLCGSPTMERGCPIPGLARDADGMARPSASLGFGPFGVYGGPGRFDIGASEHGYFVP